MVSWQKPFRGTLINKTHPLARNIVGSWIMNEYSGAQITDIIGGRSSSELTSGILWSGGGIYFDGTDEYVEIKTKQFENVFHHGATGHFSIVFRYAPAQVSSPSATKLYTLLGSEQVAGDRVQFYHKNNWGDNEFFLDVYDGWALTSVSTGIITSNLTEGQFSDIVLTWDGTNAKIYIDGIDVTSSGSLVAANFPDGTQNNFRIGDQQGTVNYLYGGVEFMYLFDRYLLQENVMQLHTKPYSIFEDEVSPAALFYEAIGAVSPTSVFYGPLVGPLGGPL